MADRSHDEDEGLGPAPVGVDDGLQRRIERDALGRHAVLERVVVALTGRLQQVRKTHAFDRLSVVGVPLEIDLV